MIGPVHHAAVRRSWSRVSAGAPTHEELADLVSAAATVADHGSLRPWRLIELRGEARSRLGSALVRGSAEIGAALDAKAAEKLAVKPLRADLLIALVMSPRESVKVPVWEQEAVASGVAHLLSLLLDDAGWGVMWRTGGLVRTESVARMHRLEPGEYLFGWLYVGGAPERAGDEQRKRVVRPEDVLSSL